MSIRNIRTLLPACVAHAIAAGLLIAALHGGAAAQTAPAASKASTPGAAGAPPAARGTGTPPAAGAAEPDARSRRRRRSGGKPATGECRQRAADGAARREPWRDGAGDGRESLRAGGAVERRRLRRARHADHAADHVDGKLVRDHHQVHRAVGAVRQARQAEREFWTRARRARGRRAAEEAQRLPLSWSRTGSRAEQHHEGTLTEQIDLNTWITLSVQRSVDAVSNRACSGGLGFLATVGSTAPFVGLFGTVWGIYHALTAIGIAGQATIDKVAGPVGEALIMTAMGLAVAVPAVLGYNWLVRRNKSIHGPGAQLRGRSACAADRARARRRRAAPSKAA